MSRKLVFAAGLITCYRLSLEPPQDAEQARDLSFLVSWLRDHVRLPPLEILADAWLKYGEEHIAAATPMYDAYDRFLSVLDDPEKRRSLDALRPEASKQDRLFHEMRDAGRAFQESLAQLFFDNPRIGPLTRKYGVF
jgi:hypothetical protein